MSLSSCHQGPKPEIDKPVRIRHEAACICITVVIDIIMSIQHIYNLVRGDLLCLLQKEKKKDID